MTNGCRRRGNPQPPKYGPRAPHRASRGRGRGRGSARDQLPPGSPAAPQRETTPTPSSPVRAPEPAPIPDPPLVLGSRPLDSYSSRVEKAYELNSHDFYDFLETSMEGSSGLPFYIAEVQILKIKERFKLVVNFNHMKRKNSAMAHYVCNNKERIWGWLMSAVRKFMLAHYDTGNDKLLISKILEKADLEFDKMPQSIQSFVTFFTEERNHPWDYVRIPFAKNVKLSMFSDIGGYMLRSAVTHLIERHRKGISWNGEWNMDDWEILDGDKVILTKDYQEGSFTPESGANDLARITTTFMDMLFAKLKAGVERPLFLMKLKIDLRDESKKITTADDLIWFRRYIISHPCYMHPLARANLIRELFLLFRTFGLFDDPRFIGFKKEDKYPYVDWRTLILLSDNHVLKEVYWYKVQVQGKQVAVQAIERELYSNYKLDSFLVVLLKTVLKKCKTGDKFEGCLFIYESSGLKLFRNHRNGNTSLPNSV